MTKKRIKRKSRGREGISSIGNVEPYAGHSCIRRFDEVLSMSRWVADAVAVFIGSNINGLSDLQNAARDLIPQSFSLGRAIRELVRKGFLFAGAVLLRSMIERTAIIAYLADNPAEVIVWKGGWIHQNRPSLKMMLNAISDSDHSNQDLDILCGQLNHLVHGDPSGAAFNVVSEQGLVGYSMGRSVDDPKFCEFVCETTGSVLVLLQATTIRCFPEIEPTGSPCMYGDR